MTDPLTVSTAYSSLKGAIDIIKTFGNLHSVAQVNAKAVELQTVILDAQAEQFSMLQRIRDLEKELANIKAWETEKKKYELKPVIPNVFAYFLKEHIGSSEPPHKICAHCYEDRRKSILQQEHVRGAVALICHSCSSEIMIAGSRAGDAPPRPRVITKRPRGHSFMGE